MTMHRIELRKWCLDCGASFLLSSGAPCLEIVADCKVCGNRAKATADSTPMESAILKPIPSRPCCDCGTAGPYQRLCYSCDTKRQTARDRIWLAGVAMQEVMRQDATIDPRQHQTWSEIAKESFVMADAMLAESKRT